jgi:hypothetical protein
MICSASRSGRDLPAHPTTWSASEQIVFEARSILSRPIVRLIMRRDRLTGIDVQAAERCVCSRQKRGRAHVSGQSAHQQCGHPGPHS